MAFWGTIYWKHASCLLGAKDMIIFEAKSSKSQVSRRRLAAMATMDIRLSIESLLKIPLQVVWHTQAHSIVGFEEQLSPSTRAITLLGTYASTRIFALIGKQDRRKDPGIDQLGRACGVIATIV